MPPSRSGLYVTLTAMGIVGGFWAFLTPLLVFLPTYESKVLTDPMIRGTAMETGRLGEVLAVVGTAAALGLLGMASTLALSRNIRFSRSLLGLIAAAFLGLTVLTAETTGWFLLAPAVFFVFPAVWLGMTADVEKPIQRIQR